MQSKIIALLTAEPNLRASEIISKLQCNPASAKVVLTKMVKNEKLVRVQTERLESVKSGRKAVYAYSIKP